MGDKSTKPELAVEEFITPEDLQDLTAAREQVRTGEMLVQWETGRLARRYQLNPGDSVNPEDGRIVRLPREEARDPPSSLDRGPTAPGVF